MAGDTHAHRTFTCGPSAPLSRFWGHSGPFGIMTATRPRRAIRAPSGPGGSALCNVSRGAAPAHPADATQRQLCALCLPPSDYDIYDRWATPGAHRRNVRLAPDMGDALPEHEPRRGLSACRQLAGRDSLLGPTSACCRRCLLYAAGVLYSRRPALRPRFQTAAAATTIQSITLPSVAFRAVLSLSAAELTAEQYRRRSSSDDPPCRSRRAAARSRPTTPSSARAVPFFPSSCGPMRVQESPAGFFEYSIGPHGGIPAMTRPGRPGSMRRRPRPLTRDHATSAGSQVLRPGLPVNNRRRRIS
jgi:hypothetical protein